MFWNVLIVVVIVLAALLAIFYFVGRKLQKKQAMQQEQIEAAKQTVTLLVIDKKKMRIKDSGLPPVVIRQTPKLMRRTKLPIVKAKVGARVMTMACDAKVFELLPVKKTVKAVISGIYIVDVKGIRGNLETPPQKKKSILSRFRKDKAKTEKKNAK